MQEGWKVKQTNTCPNCSSVVAGFHSNGLQPFVAATGGGNHTVMERCLSQERMCLSVVTQKHMQHGLATMSQAIRMSTKTTYGASDNTIVEPLHTQIF
jgi:hypothetical protein